MKTLSRRELIGRGAAIGVAAVAGGLPAAARAQGDPVQDRPGTRDAKFFPISLNTSTLRGHKLPIVETIEIAARAGYKGIEPWPNEIQDYVKSGGKLRDLRKLLRDKGLKVTGAIAFFQWMVDDDTKRSKALEEARRLMEQLAAIDATHVAAPPTGNVKDVELLRAAERYRDLLEAADSIGVIPAVEVWGFQNNLNRLGQAVLVAMEAQHPRACVLPDVYHLYKGGSGLQGASLLHRDLLAGFHLNDYPDIPREKIGDKDRVYPGDGVADLTALFQGLWKSGYRGPLSVELFNREYWKQDPQLVANTALRKTKAVMQRALAKL